MSSLTLETFVGTNATHRLPSASDVLIRQQLNGQYYVTFRYPRLPDDEDRYEAIAERNHIVMPESLNDSAAGQRFVIKSVNEVRAGIRIYKQVEAHHVGFELNRYYLDSYTDFAAAVTPETLLGQLADNTPYTFVVNGTFPPTDAWEFGEKRKHTLLDEVRTMFDAEIEYDNYTINFTTRAGANRGASVRYRKNLNGITRKSHDMERITRLYGYGKNGLTIEGYNGHTVKCIDSPYYDANHPYEDSVTFADIDTQSALYDAMQKYLRERELPSVSYDIDFVQLEKVDPEFNTDAIRGVGDTVTVYDSELGYHFDARVTEYDRYPFEPKKARVTLANFRELSASDYVWKATVGGQQAIKYTSKNAVLKGVKYDDSITLVDGMGMAVSDDLDRTRVRLGQVDAGEYGLAMYKNTGERTLWQDADTGSAKFAGDIEGANFTTNAGNFPRVEITSSSNLLRAYKAGGSYIEIDANPATYNSAALRCISGGITTEQGILSSGYYIGVAGGTLSLSATTGMYLSASSAAFNFTGGSVFNTNVSFSSIYVGSTSNIVIGSQTLATVLGTINSRLSALESAIT